MRNGIQNTLRKKLHKKANSPTKQKITYKQVATLADSILVQGELPSILRIRGLLGGVVVSNQEIADYLQRWQKEKLISTDENCNSPIKRKLLEAMQLEQEVFKKVNDLKPTLDLVNSTLEATTIDGTMIVSKEGRFLYYDQKFMEMYHLPEELMEAGDEQKALQYAMIQVLEPKNFYTIISKTYSDLEEPFEIEVFLKDGRVFKIHSEAYKVDGHLIGRIWTNQDITARKRAEEAVQSQEKFTKLANQLVHDIRSPLATLLMIVESCTQIPEADRIALREAAINIGDIANHLLSHYQKKEHVDVSTPELRKPILVSAILLQILTDKKYQYRNLPIKFVHDFQTGSYFDFIEIAPNAFKRMISNLLNNAVDAFEDSSGTVQLKLQTDEKWVRITIQDHGKGISAKLIKKIMNRIPVTAGKKSGHGIGLTQVWETIESNQGKLAINSKIGEGTSITIIFPKTKTPDWIATEISLEKNDMVVILDDDTSIHGAWDRRFKAILNEIPSIQLKHFQLATETLDFIQALNITKKQKILLLADYELLKQELNGLQVIAKSKIQRSILVTSHFADPTVREQAAKTNTKILPKHLASEIAIKINKSSTRIAKSNISKKVAAIIVDDNEKFACNLASFAFKDQETIIYSAPEFLLKDLAKYSKDTKIILDNNYFASDLKGLDIAKTLHDQGYNQLYLLSGETFYDRKIPNYITVIRKDEIDRIKNL